MVHSEVLYRVASVLYMNHHVFVVNRADSVLEVVPVSIKDVPACMQGQMLVSVPIKTGLRRLCC